MGVPQLCGLFRVFASAGPSRATGGAATLVRKAWAGDDAVVESTDVQGRILLTVVNSATATLHLWSVRNSNLTTDEMCLIDRLIKGDRLLAAVAPTSMLTYVGGNVDFKDEGDETFDLQAAMFDFRTTAGNDGQWNAGLWRAILVNYTDINAGDPTRWSATFVQASRVDEIWTAMLGWALLACVCRSSALRDVLSRRRGPSDRAPLLISLSGLVPPPCNFRPLPPRVCESGACKNLVERAQRGAIGMNLMAGRGLRSTSNC